MDPEHNVLTEQAVMLTTCKQEMVTGKLRL